MTPKKMYARRGCKVDDEALANRGIELDMPSLRSLSYNGFPVKISLESPAPELRRVNLHPTRYDNYYQVIIVKHYEPTSRMIRSFSSTRALTLNVHCIEEIAAGDVALPTFPNLKLLDLTGEYEHLENDDTQLAMARLLGSCPAMSQLRLRLKMKPGQCHRQSKNNPPGGAFSVSMDRFNRARRLGQHHAWLFEQGDAALAKFLVENAMVLKEMRINDGTQFWTEHLHNNVARWRADSFRRKNLPVTRGFSVFRA
ncbi:hypothetical protein VPH35_034978 [Triticum aestivum]|uniref:FBD domain-containing protein n=1 Tax=Aegilops tauschii TaxID=37682 RepID=M8AHX0_AEGTA